MLSTVRRIASGLFSNPTVAETVLFVHIPKTAGSTVQDALTRTFGRRGIFFASPNTDRAMARFGELTPSQQRGIRLIVGHMPVQMHKLVKGPFSYITVLRHPVDRLVSHYYYVRSNRGHYLHETVHRQRLSLEDYCLSDLSIEFDNDQVRLISGQRHEVPINAVNETHLRSAIDNIERMFGVVGVQDDLGRFFSDLETRYGVRIRRGPAKNVTRDRPKLTEVPDDVRQRILARSKWDMALYEYVKARVTSRTPNQPFKERRKVA